MREELSALKRELKAREKVPGVTKGCLLKAFEYLTSQKHPFETPGEGFWLILGGVSVKGFASLEVFF